MPRTGQRGTSYAGAAALALILLASSADAANGINAGIAAFEHGDMPTAEAYFFGALTQRKASLRQMALAHLWLGRLRVATGKVERGIAHYDSAIVIEPKMGAAYAARCEANLVLKRPDRALTDSTTGIWVEPNLPDNYLCRAKVLDAKGDVRTAQRDRSTAEELQRAKARQPPPF